MISKFLGYGALVIAVAFMCTLLFRMYVDGPGPLVFSPNELLAATWQGYVRTYVEPETFRTVDRQRDGITTSEGQSYTMLRAVWEGDKRVFDGAWAWTREHLGRSSDHLFSWLWGTRADGTQGILTDQNGGNSASDADSDIALALIFAYARWQDPSYLSAARSIVNDLWAKEVISVNGTYYLAANDIEKSTKKSTFVVNPSYLSPASYRLFSLIDPAHPWEELRADSYVVLRNSASNVLSGSATAHLPPDWIEVNRETGAIVASSSVTGKDANFGFDAIRVPFRIALDWEWFRNPAAMDLMSEFSFLSHEWQRKKELASVYAHDGNVVSAAEAAAVYGATIGYFMLSDAGAAPEVYRRKLLSLYEPAQAAWNPTLSYYDDNWVWFGVALYTHLLPNLAENLPPQAFRE